MCRCHDGCRGPLWPKDLEEDAASRMKREIHVEVPDEVEEGVVRTVTDNSNTLKLGDQGFGVE